MGLAIVAQPARPADAVGWGALPCRLFVDAQVTPAQVGARAQYRQWLLGYVSAYNELVPARAVPREKLLDEETLANAILAHCNEHPKDTVALAAAAFVKAAGSKAQRR